MGERGGSNIEPNVGEKKLKSIDHTEPIRKGQ